MNLQWTGHGADFAHPDKTLAAFDPSAHNTSRDALLVQDKTLARFLDQTRSALVWAIIGEKRAIKPQHSQAAQARFLRLQGTCVYPTRTPSRRSHHPPRVAHRPRQRPATESARQYEPPKARNVSPLPSCPELPQASRHGRLSRPAESCARPTTARHDMAWWYNKRRGSSVALRISVDECATLPVLQPVSRRCGGGCPNTRVRCK